MSTLQREFIECEDPLCGDVSAGSRSFRHGCTYVCFQDVRTEHLAAGASQPLLLLLSCFLSVCHLKTNSNYSNTLNYYCTYLVLPLLPVEGKFFSTVRAELADSGAHIDMKRMGELIAAERQQLSAAVEEDPHDMLADALIFDSLYGRQDASQLKPRCVYC